MVWRAQEPSTASPSREASICVLRADLYVCDQQSVISFPLAQVRSGLSLNPLPSYAYGTCVRSQHLFYPLHLLVVPDQTMLAARMLAAVLRTPANKESAPHE